MDDYPLFTTRCTSDHVTDYVCPFSLRPALSDVILQWQLLRPSRPLYCLRVALRLAVAAAFLVTFIVLDT